MMMRALNVINSLSTARQHRSRTGRIKLPTKLKSVLLLLDGLSHRERKRKKKRASLNARDIFPSYFNSLVSLSLSSLMIYVITCGFHFIFGIVLLHHILSSVFRAPVKKRDRLFFSFFFLFFIYLFIYLFLRTGRPPGAYASPLPVSACVLKGKRNCEGKFGRTQSEVPTGGRNYRKWKKKQNGMEEFRVFGLGARNFPSAIGC